MTHGCKSFSKQSNLKSNSICWHNLSGFYLYAYKLILLHWWQMYGLQKIICQAIIVKKVGVFLLRIIVLYVVLCTGTLVQKKCCSSISSIKCASTTNPFDMLRCEINARLYELCIIFLIQCILYYENGAYFTTKHVKRVSLWNKRLYELCPIFLIYCITKMVHSP